MVTCAITAREDASVPEIADLFARHRIKRVPIVRNGGAVVSGREATGCVQLIGS